MRLEFVVTGQAQLNWSDAHGSTPMKKEVFAILEPDNPLMTQAIDALKRYHEAQAAGLPGVEVERLRLEAEGMFQAVSEFQFRMLGHRHDTLH